MIINYSCNHCYVVSNLLHSFDPTFNRKKTHWLFCAGLGGSRFFRGTAWGGQGFYSRPTGGVKLFICIFEKCNKPPLLLINDRALTNCFIVKQKNQHVDKRLFHYSLLGIKFERTQVHSISYFIVTKIAYPFIDRSGMKHVITSIWFGWSTSAIFLSVLVVQCIL